MDFGDPKQIEFCIAFTTTGSAREAGAISEALVDERLVASVDIIPKITSVYYRKGQRNVEKRWLLIMKLRTDRVPTLKQRLPQLHSYTCPELIVLPITDGLTPYLDWVRMNT